MKRIKDIVVTTLCLLIIIGTVSVEASNYTTFVFTKKDVDSNTYTSIKSTTKLYDSNISTVKITNIYKANGSASNYKYVWVKVSGGTGTKVQKGSWYDLPVSGEYAKKWRIVTLSAKGNNAALDCQVSGNWIAY